jgi:glycosyltransferase 2 family protein
MRKINWFKIILYSSLGFLIYSLYKADYFKVPVIYSYSDIVFSILFLFAGFLIMCENWKAVIRMDCEVKITFKDAIISNGLSVFTKYIPGKLMVVLGRALFIKKKYNIPLKNLTVSSFKTQMMTLWVGITLGLLVLLKIDVGYKVILPGVSFIILFSFFLFSEKIKKIIKISILKITKKDVDYPILTIKSSLKILPSFFLNWSFWSLGFYFLTNGLHEGTVSVISGLSFALAGTLAIITLVAPGGLGVREGLLLFCLLGFGIEKQDAITISVASRLWFLVGEFFIFFLSVVLNTQKTVLIK